VDELPGKGLFGWLGRQVGHIRKAVRGNVGHKKIYENRTIEEAALPQNPNVKLRRTTIDQIVVETPKN
jgi:hypothetical protein